MARSGQIAGGILAAEALLGRYMGAPLIP